MCSASASSSPRAWQAVAVFTLGRGHAFLDWMRLTFFNGRLLGQGRDLLHRAAEVTRQRLFDFPRCRSSTIDEVRQRDTLHN
jgi:hypothetical protein